MNHTENSLAPPTLITPAPAVCPVHPRWRLVLSLFKLRIGVLIMFTALAGMAIVPNGLVTPWQTLVLALGVLVASASAGAFNQYVEADSDRLMARTKGRAFASGALQRGPRWLALMLAMLAAAVAATGLATNWVAALFVLLGALTYALVYTVGLKRRTPWNIVIGGAAGGFAVLAGAAAVSPQLGPLAWLLALVLLLWTPPHFWSLAIANRDQYAAAGVPMLPVVVGPERAARIVHWSTMALVAATLLPLGFGAGWAYGLAAVLGGANFLRKTSALAREPVRARAMAAFFASMMQLSVLILGVWLDAALR
ncbi:heme o synthase [Parapusillimonas granuli]|uniref:Protoheme IX farnesyltransferase n=1 Tax=Parapusillimonas granuli TaxID=380911 RepID=A0A853FWY2_9BURK|nr:heme o synthase [Parapusillimonas granuli]MBB5215017.1 protoheme IX farnesyltransferase [Parapusillimonas granuli]MEB2401129.1 heme o synthase [Alcaligenaceae bacterium]NYT49338.1 protoheme IX farnesyltransferase [Parapusillimonas granuli]